MRVILTSDLWLHRSQSGAEAVSTTQHSLCKAIIVLPIGYVIFDSAPDWPIELLPGGFSEGQRINCFVVICPPGSQLFLV